MSVVAVFAIYIISLFCIGLDYANEKIVGIKLKRQIFDLLCLILIIFSALKPSDFCFDIEWYCRFFKEVAPIYSYRYTFGEYEPLYCYLNSLIKTFTANYHVLFFILTFIPIILYRAIILKYAEKKFLALFVYISCFYFLNELVILRTGIASAIVLFNIQNLKNGNLKKYFLLSLLATAFHYSAIITFIIPLFYKSKNKVKSIRLLLAAIIGCAFLFWFISPMSIIASLGRQYPELYNAVLWRILRYSIEPGAGIKRIIMYIPFLWIALTYFLKECNKRNESNDIDMAYSQLIYIMVAMLCILVFSEITSMSRINQLFLTSTILIAGNFEKAHEKQIGVKGLYFLCIILISVYAFLRQNFFNSSGLVLFN